MADVELVEADLVAGLAQHGTNDRLQASMGRMGSPVPWDTKILGWPAG